MSPDKRYHILLQALNNQGLNNSDALLLMEVYGLTCTLRAPQGYNLIKQTIFKKRSDGTLLQRCFNKTRGKHRWFFTAL